MGCGLWVVVLLFPMLLHAEHFLKPCAQIHHPPLAQTLIPPHTNPFSLFFPADLHFIIPCLLSALRAQPSLLLFASPWSAPGWMKEGGEGMQGGWLREEYYDA